MRHFWAFILGLTLTIACGPASITASRSDSAAAALKTADEKVKAPAPSTEIRSAADRIWTYSLSHPRGFTLNVNTMEIPTQGICVAYAATRGSHSRESLDYVVSHSLEHDGFVGGWTDPTDSLYYFDSVRIFPETEKEAAIAFGQENGQKAAYILSSASDIPISRTVRPHEIDPVIPGATSIFLAGTIDGGNSIDWQEEAAALLEAGLKECIIYNPRQKEWHPERAGEMDYQVEWELEHLEKADFILMYFLPGSQSPITLLELGLFARSGKLFVVCTPEFYRFDNVRITCSRYGVPLHASLEDAIRAILEICPQPSGRP